MAPQAPLRVGIAGLGTVGAAVVRRLELLRDAAALRTGRPVVVTAVSARSRGKARDVALDGFTWIDDPALMAASPEVDVVVELIGGQEGAARATVEAALAAGKSVVTANKALLAHHGLALAQAAEKAGAALSFEAAVAGGIPIIKTLREGLAGNRIERVEGILNGTCNYILTRMEAEGLDFAACLAEAQRLGYAEADPSFDVDGFDTAHKLAILASLAFGVAPDPAQLHVEGIRSIAPADLRAADELGYRIKLLGVAQRVGTRIDGRVNPTMVPKSSALAQVGGVTNAVTMFADAVGELTLIGPGAGGEATASAVVADIVDIARGAVSLPFGMPAAALEPAAMVPPREQTNGFYLRLSVRDRPGAVASIAARMAREGISFESIVQRHPPTTRPGQAADAVPVVLVTYETVTAHLYAALEAVVADDTIVGTPQVICIDRR